MASSAVEICNIALGRIGQGQFITSLQGQTAEAKACAVFYETAVGVVLESHPWQFATKRATLAELNTTRDGWLYVYALPDDCLTPRYIPSSAGVREPLLPEEARAEWGLEEDENSGQVIVTDQADAVLVYTKEVTDVLLFPALFVDALAWKLAADLALRIPVKPGVALQMEKAYLLKLAFAAAKDSNKSKVTQKPLASYIRARGGGSGV